MTNGWVPANTIRGAPGTARGDVDVLDVLRTSAGKWQAAQLGIIGLVSVVGLVKGSDDIRKLAGWAQVTIGILLGAAFFAALVAIYLVSFLAYRLPRFRLQPPTPQDPDVGAFRNAKEGSQRLQIGVILTFLAAILVAAAVAITWYAPDQSAPDTVQVTTSSGVSYCGNLVELGPDRVVLEVGGVSTTFPAGVTVRPVGSCP